MNQVFMLYMLGYCAIKDLLTKKLEVWAVTLFFFQGVICIYIGDGPGIFSVIAGALSGAVMIIASIITRGAVGIGDGVIVLITGMFLGIRQNMELLIVALLLCAVTSLVFITVFRKNRRYEIPFIPFLTLGYLSMYLIRFIGSVFL